LRHTDRIDISEIEAGLKKRLANHGNDLAQVFAGGEFGDYAAVWAVDVDLGGYDAGEDFAAVGDYGCGGFVAGGFDA
jgi:hypothetical protein